MSKMGKKQGHHDFYAVLPEAIWERLKQEADANERSATAQLVWILRQRYEGHGPDVVHGPEAEPPKPTVKKPARQGKGGKRK